MSGCLDFFDLEGVTYETHPTKVQYTIQYGYTVSCSGLGEHEINYDCDIPELLKGTISYELLHTNDYVRTQLANNSIIRWNVTGKNNKNYELGIVANVTAQSFLVSNLNGENALTLQGIQTLYPDLVDQYCQDQIDSGITYIESNNTFIKSTTDAVLSQLNSNNSFLVAKGLFKWLKENTEYQIHIGDEGVQTAMKTYQLRTGDCDDLSFLYISLCRTVGIPARFVRGYLAEEIDEVVSPVAHAWAEIFVGGSIGNDGWIPVECACTSDNCDVQIYQNFGIEDVGHLRLFTDDGSAESLNASLSGPRIKYETGINVIMTAFVEIDDYSILESNELFIDGEGHRSYI
jgi:hypothetical protein